MTVLITLTWPSGFEPSDIDAQVGKFAGRWLMAFRSPLVGSWRQEFHRRGVPALHLVTEISGLDVDVVSLRFWVARAWYEVVGSGDLRHLRAISRCEMTP